MRFDSFFDNFTILFIAVSILSVGVMIAVIAAAVRRKHQNDRLPVMTVTAAVISKRKSITNHRHPIAGDVSGSHGYHTVPVVRCFVVFQTDAGSPIELTVNETVYGFLREGDSGLLTYQGDGICNLIVLERFCFSKSII